MNENSKMHRLFFALWPTDKVRSSIGDVILKYPPLGVRLVESNNLHLTLHFLGQVTESDRQCVHAAAQSFKTESFKLNLDHFGYFTKAKIFWMGSQKMPAQLSPLHERLGHAIAECGFIADERPYAPHVTLMRKSMNPVVNYKSFCIPWVVEEFVLVESVQGISGVEYRVIETYPLS